METIERVQRRVTGMLPGLESMPYENRLNELSLFPLERRRVRGNLLKVYKMMRGINRVDSQRLLPSLKWLAREGTGLKCLDVGTEEMPGMFFIQRVESTWKELPAAVVEIETIESFM